MTDDEIIDLAFLSEKDAVTSSGEPIHIPSFIMGAKAVLDKLKELAADGQG